MAHKKIDITQVDKPTPENKATESSDTTDIASHLPTSNSPAPSECDPELHSNKETTQSNNSVTLPNIPGGKRIS